MAKAFTCKWCETFNPETPGDERGVCAKCGRKRAGRGAGSKNKPKAQDETANAVENGQ